MFCFQCQETCSNTACRIQGVCGKKPETANLQDLLIRNLKDLAKTIESHPDAIAETGLTIAKSLFMTITNANFDNLRIQTQCDLIEALVKQYGGTLKTEIGISETENKDVRSLRELLIYGMKGVAAYTVHAAELNLEDPAIYQFLVKGLVACTKELSIDCLVALEIDCGNIAVKAMALLDKANTSTYGHPEVSHVNIGVGERPGILISGHDLHDMKDLLEQTKDCGIDIYTHSEMLPANYYPAFKKYAHLHGNYGNAWHQQAKEFAMFNGPILMTTNCITPVQGSYKDRIFTTGQAGYEGIPHIVDRQPGGQKDFSKIIALAKTCQPPTPLEEGEIVGGFAHNQVLALADQIVNAVKAGKIKRFVVMAGCDGRLRTREYFTQVAEQLPKDAVILTAGCAKYRYNKLKLGDIGGIPRVLDAGQCNDCYSLALIALKLKEVFLLTDVNDLPLAFDIAWYEQKAVAVLLALLALGFKNIRLGPTLPAFLSPNVVKLLVENFGMMPIVNVENDVACIMTAE